MGLSHYSVSQVGYAYHFGIPNGAVTLQRMSQRMPMYEDILSERWYTSRALGRR